MGGTFSFSHLSIWFTRNIYIPGIKRYDGTAMGVAKIRMTESLIPNEDQRVIDDPYAKHFIIGAWVMELMGAPLIKKKYDEIMPGLYSMIVGRTRFLDELCQHGAGHGQQQMLILGAGYDTRCIRLNLPIPCFEVDQPEVHVLKKAGLDDLSLTDEQRARVHLIQVDFNSTSSNEDDDNEEESSMVRKVGNFEGFVKGAKTIILFEGVTQYIPKESTAKTMKDISELVGKGSILGISYVNEVAFSTDPQMVERELDTEYEKVKEILSKVKGIGEPWVTGWSKDSFQEFLATYSFEVKEDVCISDLEDRYFTPRGVTAMPFCQLERFVWAKCV